MSKCEESILIFGPSGVGKTTQAQFLAEYLHKRDPDKVLRLASCSGGGWRSIQAAIDLGLVETFWMRHCPYPFETLDRVCKGWWPEDPSNPLSPLVPPKEDARWPKVGAIFIDSLTEAGEWLMQTSVTREAAGDIKISQESIAASFRDGSTRYGQPARAHYGTIQNTLATFVAQSKTIEGRIVVWTALELKAADDTTRLPLYGPDVIGKAKTAVAPAWFDDVIHLHFKSDLKGAAIREMWLVDHFEADGIPYKAKNRGHFLSPLPPVLTGSEIDIGYFLELLDASHRSAAEQIKLRLKK